MMPTFVRGSTVYEAYGDFWKLVETSGFAIVTAKEVRFHGDTYIWPTLDEEFMRAVDAFPKGKRPGKLIFWNLERPDGSGYRGKMDITEIFQKGTGEILQWADAVWVSDKHLSSLDSRVLFATLGGSPALRERKPQEEPVYDVLHLGQKTPRRAEVLKALSKKGLRVAEGSWGMDRAQGLSSSRLLLSIDRVSGLHLSTPFRVALAASYGVPLLTEQPENPYPMIPGESILVAPYERLVEAALRAIEVENLPRIGEVARKLLCEDWTFHKGVMDALERTA